MAGVLPALPMLLVIWPSTLLWSMVWSFPAWVAAFYIPLPKVKLLAVTGYAAHCALLNDAYWEMTGLHIVFSLFCGMSLNLAHSAFWDALEPKLIGKERFGAGEIRRVPRRQSDGVATASRVTAATAVAAGDPQKGAAASAFTQAELDTLTLHGIQPWDPQAQDALKRL